MEVKYTVDDTTYDNGMLGVTITPNGEWNTVHVMRDGDSVTVVLSDEPLPKIGSRIAVKDNGVGNKPKMVKVADVMVDDNLAVRVKDESTANWTVLDK